MAWRQPIYIVPNIRLSGQWLQKLGFYPEGRVSVIAREGELVLRVEEASSQPFS
jgi:hypothetical protein